MSEWIKCSERLPEAVDWYLVAATTEAPGGGERVSTMAFFDHDAETGTTWWLAHNDTEADEWSGVTHWMPLPEPPK